MFFFGQDTYPMDYKGNVPVLFSSLPWVINNKKNHRTNTEIWVPDSTAEDSTAEDSTAELHLTATFPTACGP